MFFILMIVIYCISITIINLIMIIFYLSKLANGLLLVSVFFVAITFDDDDDGIVLTILTLFVLVVVLAFTFDDNADFIGPGGCL